MNAQELARNLARAVDRGLKEPRDPADKPTDGQVAVMVVFRELEAMGYVLVRSRPV
jgi:hypothetical protein